MNEVYQLVMCLAQEHSDIALVTHCNWMQSV